MTTKKKTPAVTSKPLAKNDEPEVLQKKVKTYEVKLSAEELAHFRDLMSILLPPTGDVTLSQSLANTNGTQMVEAKLWTKVTDLCKQAGVPTDDEAPDYAVGVASVPALTVYQIHGTDEEK